MARMRRRDFVKAMVAAPVAAKALLTGTPAAAAVAPDVAAHAAAAAAAQAAMPAKDSFDYRKQMLAASVPDAVALPEAHFFTAAQMATLRKLGEVFMPAANGYPSAAQAKAPEFLDFLMSVAPAERRQNYQMGLDRLNAEAHTNFKIPFAQVDAEQADKLIRPWLRGFLAEHPPREPYAHFINIVHYELRLATQNSRAWTVAALSVGDRAPGIGDYWSPIDPHIEKYV